MLNIKFSKLFSYYGRKQRKFLLIILDLFLKFINKYLNMYMENEKWQFYLIKNGPYTYAGVSPDPEKR